MENNNAASKIDYEFLERQRTQALQDRLRQQLTSRDSDGKIDSLRRHVLKCVVEAQYDDANKVIEDYIEMKSLYPKLRERVEVQMRHSAELINAIRAKRNFPGLHLLSMSKQQEILEHAIHHFDELKLTLKGIEQIVRDEALQDIRSTVWVVRSATYSVVAIIAAAFIVEFSGALGQPLWTVFNDVVDVAYMQLAKYLPFL